MIKLLILRTKTSQEAIIKELLQKSGIRTFSTHSIFRMHDLLEGQGFDGVIIERKKLDHHCINPMRHLWDYLSPILIISYAITKEGIVSADCAQLPDHELASPQRQDRTLVAEKIIAALSGKTIHLEERKCIVFPPEGRAKPVLHRKMGRLLEILIAAGQEGAHPDMLADELLNHRGSSWKKDIQSYISKLRTILSQDYGTRYRIAYTENRYFLIDTDAE